LQDFREKAEIMKTETQKTETPETVEDALKAIGFEKVVVCAGGVLLASGVQDFGTAHATAILTLSDRANFVRVSTACGPVLRVRVLKLETRNLKLETETED
jgi:hypothetical protein